jgi:hypothetical protein
MPLQRVVVALIPLSAGYFSLRAISSAISLIRAATSPTFERASSALSHSFDFDMGRCGSKKCGESFI